MKLSRFITARLEDILAEWESFARTQQPEGAAMSSQALRDHAKQILQAIALDMDTAQTPGEQKRKSQGLADEPESADSAASTHGTLRQLSGFSLMQLNAEFRALRATVLRLWLPTVRELDEHSTRDMVRFNETIDQALAESIVTYNAKALRSRDTFLAILGHDLRSPLQAIQIAVGGLLAGERLGPREQRFALTIQRSSVRMARMIDNVIDLARTHLGRGLPAAPVRCDMGELCQAVVDELATAHPTRHIDVAIDGDLRGTWDPDRVFQALSNLISNAIQHGGDPIKVEARVEEGDRAVITEVKNHGGFGRHASNGSSGLGLGLFIVQQIALAHGGICDVVSDESGTTFSIRWPRTPGHARRVAALG